MYHSQIGQDKWVQSVLGNKKNGYFIELGACDGLLYSNTLYFERENNWNGICIEPNDLFFEKLKINRKCNISNKLVYSVPNILMDFALCESVSGITDQNIGPFTKKNNTVKKYTSTLEEVLDEFNAPKIIDYLSLDVEGQEYNILSTFPFEKYNFRCMTIEHNAPHIGPATQNKIRALVESKGYKYVKGNDDVNNWGHGPIDDFYIHPDLI